MILVNLNKLRNLSFNLTHNHSGEYGGYYWKVINFQNSKEPNKYNYEISFSLKLGGRSIATRIFYRMNPNDKDFNEHMDCLIQYYTSGMLPL